LIVLGIDPGTAALGYGIVERNGTLRAIDFGCLVTGAERPMPERLLAIHDLVRDLITLHEPDIMAIERVYFSRNVQTAFAVGQARGVVLLAAAERGLAVREATPSEVKSAVAGYGSADKPQVARMVQLLLGMAAPPTPDDAADGLAVAVWAAHRLRPGEQPTAAVLDRAAVAPIDRGSSPYERAVRDALRRERSGAAGTSSGSGHHGAGGAKPTKASDPSRRRRTVAG
jgi:crossover junction endodeoxyribonuclease RuvC